MVLPSKECKMTTLFLKLNTFLGTMIFFVRLIPFFPFFSRSSAMKHMFLKGSQDAPRSPRIQHQQPQAMNLCSQRSRSVRITPPHPSPGRGSFITAPCNKKAPRIIPNPSTKKKMAVENRVRGFSCVVFLSQPSETTKRVQLALRISTSKKVQNLSC